MIYLTFIIPVITCLILFLQYRKSTVWWEYTVVLLPSVLVSFATEWGMVRYNTDDTQYLGSCANSVRHYDDWDEWIHQTCYRTMKSGKTTISVPYDCSYRLYHEEKWVACFDDGSEREIDRPTYQSYLRQWNTPMQSIDMNRRYYRKDGDAQQYAWNRQWYNALTFTEPDSYENRLRGARTLYDLSEVSREDIDLYHLKDYPPLRYTDRFGLERTDHQPIQGATVSDSLQRRFQFINGYYGARYQFRIYVVLFPGQPVTASVEQRNLMEGGNKNELVVCIGTDSTATRVSWANTFSWCDNPALEVRLKQTLATQDTLCLYALADEVESGLADGLWHRKEFSEYGYIKVDLSPLQSILFLLIVLVVNIAVSLWVVRNQYRN